MKYRIIILLIVTLLLAGCGQSTPTEVDESSTLMPFPEPVVSTEIPASPAVQENANEDPVSNQPQQPAVQPEKSQISLSLECKTMGEWHMECTLELLQFAGGDCEELENANLALRSIIENAERSFDECAGLTDIDRTEKSISWCDIWAYPVVGERYVNAVWTSREWMHYRIGVYEPWNLVDSMVYDLEDGRFLALEEALQQAVTDISALEQAVCAFVSEMQLGTCEELSSLAFYMEEDDMPVFMIGAVVNCGEDMIPWPAFFTWKNGEVAWQGEHPLPLEQVSTLWDELSCLQSMRQYDGAATISEKEAVALLCEIYEVQQYLAQGMKMMIDGQTAFINGEHCGCIVLGTEHEEMFVNEIYYAVTYDIVYRMNELTGEWEEVAFG